MAAIGYPTFEGMLMESYSTMSYADMVIDCVDGAVPCHRYVLAAASPFLRPLLRDYNPIESHRILLPDVSVSTMKHVLAILYMGQTYSPAMDDFVEIMEAIKLLGIDFECDLYGKHEEGVSKSWDVSSVLVTPEVRHPESELQFQQKELASLSQVLTVAGSARDTQGGCHVSDTISGSQTLDCDEVILKCSDETNFELTTQVSPTVAKRKTKLLMTHKPSTVRRVMFPPNSQQRIPNAQRSLSKSKLNFQKKRIHVTTTETADVIKQMLQSGQLCLAPGPALKAPRKVSTGIRTAASVPTNKNRSVFQNIPQNFVRLPPGNVILNPKTEETLHHLPEAGVEEGETPLEEEPPVYVIHGEGDVYTSHLDIPIVDSGRMTISDRLFDSGHDRNRNDDEMEDEEDYSMTPEEILDAAKISSRKDHAYANFGQNQKRPSSKPKMRKLPKVVQMKGSVVLI